MDGKFDLQGSVMLGLSLAISLGVLVAGVVLLRPQPPSSASNVGEWNAATKFAQYCGALLAFVACAFIAASLLLKESDIAVTVTPRGQQAARGH